MEYIYVSKEAIVYEFQLDKENRQLDRMCLCVSCSVSVDTPLDFMPSRAITNINKSHLALHSFMSIFHCLFQQHLTIPGVLGSERQFGNFSRTE